MNIDPVTIICSDKRRFLTIAQVVDNFDCFQMIHEARKELDILEFYKREMFSSDEFKEEYNKYMEISVFSTKPEEEIKELTPTARKLYLASEKAKKILREIKRGKSFVDILTFGILCNEVWDKDLDQGATLLNGSDLFDLTKDGEFYIDKTEAAIIITPETTQHKLLEQFRKYHKELPLFDTISNVERDRRWCWLSLNGLSYSQIHQMEYSRKDGERITERGVGIAIKRYREVVNRYV